MRGRNYIVRVVARGSCPSADGRSESGHVSGFVVRNLLEAATSPGREASLGERVLVKLGEGTGAREVDELVRWGDDGGAECSLECILQVLEGERVF